MRLSARRRPGQAKEPGGAHTEFLLEVPSRRSRRRRRRSVELTLIGFTVFTGTSEASKEGSKVTGVLGSLRLRLFRYLCVSTN